MTEMVWFYLYGSFYIGIYYSLRPEILVGEMDESRRILVIDTSHFIHFSHKYFATKGVDKMSHQIFT